MILTRNAPPRINDIGPVIAAGNFDGVHLGHQFVLKHALSQRRRFQKVAIGVLSFYPHPRQVIEGKRMVYITPLRVKYRILSELGLDFMWIIRFNETLRMMRGAEFLDRFIVGKASKLIIGSDTSFGKDRDMNSNEIKEYLEKRGVQCDVLEKIKGNGNVISSSYIKRLIREGKVGEANSLLGREYEIEGRVVRGDGRGKMLGFPTANLHVRRDQLLPKDGVYGGSAVLDGRTYLCAISVGNKPMFNGTSKCVEGYLIDYVGEDFYGRRVSMKFSCYVREQRSFDSLEELKDAISSDINHIRERISAEK